jgi:hypothetical protein
LEQVPEEVMCSFLFQLSDVLVSSLFYVQTWDIVLKAAVIHGQTHVIEELLLKRGMSIDLTQRHSVCIIAHHHIH